MSHEEAKSFAEFWPRYVADHSQRGTRALHAAGTIGSTGLAVALLATGRWRWLPLALATGYGAAWVSHFFIEHNKPATFQHPLWSFIADYKMLALILTGKMQQETIKYSQDGQDTGVHDGRDERDIERGMMSVKR